MMSSTIYGFEIGNDDRSRTPTGVLDVASLCLQRQTTDFTASIQRQQFKPQQVLP